MKYRVIVQREYVSVELAEVILDAEDVAGLRALVKARDWQGQIPDWDYSDQGSRARRHTLKHAFRLPEANPKLLSDFVRETPDPATVVSLHELVADWPAPDRWPCPACFGKGIQASPGTTKCNDCGLEWYTPESFTDSKRRTNGQETEQAQKYSHQDQNGKL